MAGRSSGMFSRPSIHGRQRNLRNGPRKMNFASQNPTASPDRRSASSVPVPTDSPPVPLVRRPVGYQPARPRSHRTGGMRAQLDAVRPVPLVQYLEPFSADGSLDRVVVSDGARIVHAKAQ